METLPRLIDQKNAIYDEADKLQTDFEAAITGTARNSMTTIKWTHQRTQQRFEEQHFDKTWAEVYERVRELRSQSHAIVAVNAEGDRTTSFDLHQMISALFDQAADIEAKIQAARQAALQEGKAA